jgi:hypothetical protein
MQGGIRIKREGFAYGG